MCLSHKKLCHQEAAGAGRAPLTALGTGETAGISAEVVALAGVG
jgi:hypothetical protein